MQKEVNLVKKIEEVVGKQMEEFECKENDALADITKVLHLFQLKEVIEIHVRAIG